MLWHGEAKQQHVGLIWKWKNTNKRIDMWYFTWILGIGFAVLLAILNAMWGENQFAREEADPPKQ